MKIQVSIHNDESQDLFVWVWDLNTYDKQMVLDSIRFNPGEIKNIQVEGSQDSAGLLNWLAQRCDSPDQMKEEDNVTISANSTLDVNVLGAAIVRLLEVADPQAIACVEALVAKTELINQKGFKVISVQEIRMLWGELTLELDQMKSLPTKYEEESLQYINDTDEPKPHNEKLTVTTKRATTLQTTRAIKTEQEFRIGVKFSPTANVALNADLISRSSFEIATKSEDSVSEEVKIELEEHWTVPPRSEYFIKKRVSKGLVSAPVAGKLVIDAFVRCSLKLGIGGPTIFAVWLSHDRLLPDPRSRMIDYNGTLTSESYSATEVRHRAVPLKPDLAKAVRLLGFGGDGDDGGWIGMG